MTINGVSLDVCLRICFLLVLGGKVPIACWADLKGWGISDVVVHSVAYPTRAVWNENYSKFRAIILENRPNRLQIAWYDTYLCIFVERNFIVWSSLIKSWKVHVSFSVDLYGWATCQEMFFSESHPTHPVWEEIIQQFEVLLSKIGQIAFKLLVRLFKMRLSDICPKILLFACFILKFGTIFGVIWTFLFSPWNIFHGQALITLI